MGAREKSIVYGGQRGDDFGEGARPIDGEWVTDLSHIHESDARLA